MSYTNGLDNPELFFQTVLWTGNGSSSRSITLDGSEDMQPDWVWLKKRNGTTSNHFYDSVRGATNALFSDQSDGTYTASNLLTAFNTDGFTVGNDTGVNNNSDTFVAWNWKAGTSFSNDASSTGIGTIDSTGSASDTAGFSIVSYTGTGSAGTIKHGLSSVPKVIICKNRDTVENWITYHEPLGAGKFLRLNQDNAETTSSNFWNDTTPTSSVFSVATGITVNNSGDDIVAYCFAEKKGYSKIGSYTGTGSAGNFIYLGFKPAFILVKRSDATDVWHILDNKRDPFNKTADSKYLQPSSSTAEYDNNRHDFFSNGFQLQAAGTNSNASGGTYIYLAFAESSFVNSSGVPNNAR